jgi:regulator of protease activity HflC (stomatin/prohibitin superfamily)
VSLKIQHLEVRCDTKSRDNVFVSVSVVVQYRVMENKVASAYYKLTDPRAQISSYVHDVIRSTLPKLELDEAFASKDEIAYAVKNQLTTLMFEYGFEIVAALVVDLSPNAHVKKAMNDINGTCPYNTRSSIIYINHQEYHLSMPLFLFRYKTNECE